MPQLNLYYVPILMFPCLIINLGTIGLNLMNGLRYYNLFAFAH